MLRRCAMSLTRTSTALGAFYRRLAARMGKAKAITATARKLAVLIYRALSGRLAYKDPGAIGYYLINRAPEIKPCANAPSYSALNSSTSLPERSFSMRTLFLERCSRKSSRRSQRILNVAFSTVPAIALVPFLLMGQGLPTIKLRVTYRVADALRLSVGCLGLGLLIFHTRGFDFDLPNAFDVK